MSVWYVIRIASPVVNSYSSFMLDQLNESTGARAVASIPVVDLRTATAEEFTNQLIAGSCVFVVGHGIDPQLRSEMNRVSRAFFALPREVKAQVRWQGTG